MKILLVYGTNSSGTESASAVVAKGLTDLGHSVTVERASEAKAQDFSNYDLVILGSCTWDNWIGKERHEGQLQQHMAAFVAQAQGLTFPQHRFAVFGLGDSSYQKFCAAVDHLEAFVRQLQGQLLVPSLRIDGYYGDRDNNDAAITAWATSINAALK